MLANIYIKFTDFEKMSVPLCHLAYVHSIFNALLTGPVGKRNECSLHPQRCICLKDACNPQIAPFCS